MTTLIQTIEQDVEAFVEAAWTAVKPQVIALGATVLSQVEQAAETIVSSGGNFAEGLASVVGQLPGDVKALEAIVANALSAQIVKLQATAAAAQAPTPATPPAAA